ncbi:Nicotinamide nucleotide repair protein [Nocardia otitidiscaviarum]|uniref:Bifunctional NAD(P)H-hydrate repair enzyme n=1 Tax=Nocardia otitidiscaviarum TaxID=1823 RepID=A0A378YK92_9NOCA|nr:NAD(P)H-hydrate dehydratase [Nocardia otitidiscaviarum]SUA76829.1 Nicotinamide nucleotide repair protein [Nocardia otitidiscaviarum]
MRGYFTADEVRAAEAELFTRVPAGMPMRRAAFGLADVVARELRERTGGVAGRTVTLLVGSGDNGGDALWAGSMLRRRGVAVHAVLLSPERVHREGLAALRRTGGRIREELGTPDLVVDGIVGISGKGALRPRAAELVAAVQVPIIAADLPSGVDADTGAISGPAVRADVTVTFGAYKPVHALAAAHCGRIVLVPIGLRLPKPNLAALEPESVGADWPVPGAADDKYTQGVTGVCAGSATYPGAAVLCTGAAVAATSGMVRYAGTGCEQVLEHCPEVIAAPSVKETGRVQSWVFGPGAGTDAAARDRLAEILATDLPVVVDADGLTLLAQDPSLATGRTAATVLTPHAGEFARLTGADPSADRVAAVRELADSWQVTVLLKGRATLVATPGRPVLVNEAGGSWAATAGSGDVLSGIIGALLAAGRDPSWAAAAAARAHSLAANLAAHAPSAAGAPISASPLLTHLRPAIGTLRDLAAR